MHFPSTSPFGFTIQAEKNVADECEGLSEQRKAVALARVRLHEQQMEMSLQVGLGGPGMSCRTRRMTIPRVPAA